uniref:PR domain zinc finger protein 16 n=1 Tax=Cacopsylla melanoneura TaxID=428564 RepID=A0A8D9EN75_9HEMI
MYQRQVPLILIGMLMLVSLMVIFITVRTVRRNQCSKTFASKSYLKVHMFSHEGIRFPCDSCSQSFAQRSILKAHQRQVHEGIKNYACNQCSKTFARSTDLKRHELIHEGIRFPCDKCSKSYSEKGKLKKHQIEHEYECDITYT